MSELAFASMGTGVRLLGSDPARLRAARAEVERLAAVARPPGVRLDLGGSAKGFIADRVAARLGEPCAVDCGGDMRVRGSHAVHVRHPLTGGTGATAVAPTATEAEARAKAALLAGPDEGRAWLLRYGGVIVADEGTVWRAPLTARRAARPRVIVRRRGSGHPSIVGSTTQGVGFPTIESAGPARTLGSGANAISWSTAGGWPAAPRASSR